eukprot:242006-Chlamydomonas_euryale.AAC.9
MREIGTRGKGKRRETQVWMQPDTKVRTGTNRYNQVGSRVGVGASTCRWMDRQAGSERSAASPHLVDLLEAAWVWDAAARQLQRHAVQDAAVRCQ